MVPLFLSSANSRIVTAGAKTTKSIGASAKKLRSVA